MGVRNSGPVVDCLTPVGWQVQMVREKGNGEMIKLPQKYSFPERQIEL